MSKSFEPEPSTELPFCGFMSHMKVLFLAEGVFAVSMPAQGE